MHGLSLFALFSGAFCIALSPIWVRVSEVGPTASAFWRVALAIPLLWILFAFNSKGKKILDKDQYLPLLATGLAFAGDLAFWHWSIQYTSVANSTLLPQYPRRQRDEDRRQIRKQCRVGDRGVPDRPVPEREIAREREAGGEQKAKLFFL